MRIFIKSFGCSANLADGEVLAGCLARVGHILVNDSAEADLVICNTCAVKGPTENRMISYLRMVPRYKKLIVVGCLPLINFERLCREVHFDGVAGPALGDKIVEIVERVSRGEKVVELENGDKTKPRITLPRIRVNPVIGIVPISYGCLGSCAYCCVVFARGRLRSYSIEEIVWRVKEDTSSGAKEIWITSQDAACYGRDIGVNLVELLEAICKIDGYFKVRVGMMNPNFAMDILEDLVKVFSHEKIFKFIHLPLQSGDDQILKAMRRFYSVTDFRNVVETFRRELPEITLATDIICGFPGETDESFEKTLAIIKEVEPDIVNISKFFPRPRTTAASMKDHVPASVIKARSVKLANLAKEIALKRNKKWIGWVGEVLIDEAGSVRGSWVGRNFAYKPVVVKNNSNLLGKVLDVSVVNATCAYLEAEVVDAPYV
ncbi:MAG: tRNA (N(6)-L-threonylcarbamoyladenosine(37)-C(2))-methylthiotransferase [Nitrososphaerota archaeon]|nr:tRNA (N(6)-L-threonylcarbamoyladenosine(37)-C(2))-methylthiotransferase [Candidatus Bathyarchaeota archaeon]MDW8194112.1 tRNA (N(6)-L-threonylcarbamoyladenosine(37)-C(2))-methylthiotransferase [Nitrososphaerota archaeon]